MSPWRRRRFTPRRRRPVAFPLERLEVRLALSAAEQVSWHDAALPPEQATHVWSVVEGTELLDAAATYRLSSAVSIGSQRVLEAVSTPAFEAVARSVFGGVTAPSLATLRSDFADGRFSLPVQLVPRDVLGTAIAAYSTTSQAGGERIYVNADWLKAGPDLGWLTRVLVEEAGHAIDRRLNGDIDAMGDEGQWFAAVVMEDAVGVANVRAWQSENDHGVIVVDGTAVRVEFSGPGDAPPVVNLVDTTKTVTENQAASTLFPNATVSDTDSADFEGGALLVRNLAAGDVVTFSTTTNNASGAIWRSGDSLMRGNGTTSVVIGSISGGTNTSPLSIVFSSSLVTPAVAQTILRATTFFNNSEAPVASRQLSVVLSDGDGGISTAQLLTVNVTAVNDRPVISNPSQQFVLNSPSGTTADPSGSVGVALNDLFTTGRITDPDGTPWPQLGIAITTILGSSDIAGFWFTSNGGTTWTNLVSGNADTDASNAIFLANTSSTRVYVQSKRSQQAPQVTSVFNLRAWDLSKAAVSTSSSPTTITTDFDTSLSAEMVGVTFNFISGSAPTNTYPASFSVAEDTRLKLSGISVADADNNITSLKLSVTSGALYGAAAGGVTVDGSGTSVLTLTGSAADINTFLGSATTQPEFQSATNFNGSVTLGLLTTDSSGLVDSDNVPITVTAVNDAPLVDLDPTTSGTGVIANYVDGGGPVAIAPQATLQDVDSAMASSLTATLTTRPDGNSAESLSVTSAAAATASSNGLTVTYTASTGVLSITGSATLEVYQSVLRGVTYANSDTTPTPTDRSITVTVSDGSASSSVATAAVKLVDTNNTPVLVQALVDQTVTANLPFSFAVPSGAFVDPEGDTLTYRATLTNGSPLPGWLSFDATTRRFTGVPPTGGAAQNVRVTAIDPLGQSTSDDFVVTVAGTLNGESVTSVSFPKVYELVNAAVHSTSGYYMEETNSFTTGTPSIIGTNFVFYQVGVTRFSGNNVPGVLAYIDGNGLLQQISGIASRPVKTPGNVVDATTSGSTTATRTRPRRVTRTTAPTCWW